MNFGIIPILRGSRPALVSVLAGVGALIVGANLARPAAAAPTETVLHSFGVSLNDGADPYAGLIRDASGALYGTTYSGNGPTTGGYGTMFKLTPPAAGHTQWTESVLYSFKGNDGSYPFAGLIFDSKGALYGTTSTGGKYGYGTVFELTPPAAGHTHWTETVLYSFKGGSDGNSPQAGLIFDTTDTTGALYGTTSQGGGSGCGTVFKLAPPAARSTQWTETVLHSFQGGNDGCTPTASLVMDRSGVLYGTTEGGGSSYSGTVFKLAPPAAGHTQWSETLLHTFAGGSDGSTPYAGLTQDSSGALYGTVVQGGTSTYGAVFKLAPPAAGHTQWTKSGLHGFNGKDGAGPYGGVIFDNNGALYGTTSEGFTDNGGFNGTVFKLTPPTAGNTHWTETVLHSFTSSTDGDLSYANVVLDSTGALYGTTRYGGSLNEGTVFKVQQ